MKNTVMLAMLVVLVAAITHQADARQNVLQLDSLSMAQAVQLALQHHPSIRGANAALSSASAQLTQAEASYFPSVTASASFSRTDGAFVFNPSIPTRLQSYNNYTSAVQVQQNIFDFGKTIGRVSAGSDFLSAADADLASTTSTVIMNAQLAYLAYVQAIQIERVNEQAVDEATRHLAETKAFYTVGTRAQFDVTKAEVDLANANVDLIRGRNQVRVQRLQLENAMGVHPEGEFHVQDISEIEPFDMPMDSTIHIAYAERPELLAARARVSANEALVSAAWSQHLPTLSAFGTLTYSNYNLPLFGRWNAGVTLSFPIFLGFSLNAQVNQAEANAEIARSNLDLLLESTRLDVEQNYLGLKEARERITATQKLVEEAEQGLNLAERQYAAGVGTALEVTDAQLTLSNARIARIQALSDYSSSLVRLKNAMGVLKSE